MKIIDGIPVYGEIQQNAMDQMINCKGDAYKCALMADHHLGYAVPIGGVIAYENHISPSGVGYDIACGNKAVKLDMNLKDIRSSGVGSISWIMDRIYSEISFGVGRKNQEEVDHDLFYDELWNDSELLDDKMLQMARGQLGTVGSGNHYVDIFHDEEGWIWVGVHFGSRGLGHKIATHFVKEGGGKDGINVDPVLLDVNIDLGRDYIRHMELAGRYAYAGRDWVCSKVASILEANEVDSVHNHHNYAWMEYHFGRPLWVVRKGATPAFPKQRGFVGGSMGEQSVILEGVDSEESENILRSTVHGAGRVLSRSQAAGKKRWKKGKITKQTEGCISKDMMMDWVNNAGVELRGAGTDESPHCYKRLNDVLEEHSNTINILHRLTPIGVAMAGENEFDPFKD